MKQAFSKLSVALFVTFVAMFTSCKKDAATELPSQNSSSLLTAKTWQVEEVTDYVNGLADRQYKKGATNNQSDFSGVRQKFNSNGTITYVDEFGNSGSNGHWQLLDNDTKIKLTMGFTNYTIVCDNFTVSNNSFSYKLKSSATDYTLFVFSPIP